MPYGLPKELDNEKNNLWMENCVNSILQKGKIKDKSTAIAVCKANLVKHRGNMKSAELELSLKLADPNISMEGLMK